MPRAKKKAPQAAAPYKTGEATQAPQAPTGMPYGDHKQMIDVQAAAPLAGPSHGPPPEVPAPDPLAAATAMPFAPMPLSDPPGQLEPLSTGLRAGPGAGPESLRGTPPDQLADTLQMMARTTRDPRFEIIAQRARMRGR